MSVSLLVIFGSPCNRLVPITAVMGLAIAASAVLFNKLHNAKNADSTASPHAAGCDDFPSLPNDMPCVLISIYLLGWSIDNKILPSGLILIIESPLPITHPEPSEKYIVHHSPLTYYR